MKYHKQHDWLPVVGETVQIRNNGKIVQTGIVDAVTNDGAILWLAAEGVNQRRLITRADGNEVWMIYKWETQEAWGDRRSGRRPTDMIQTMTRPDAWVTA